jgi:[ribosomal protein S18]-alanine N-acetyltransferase
MRRMRYVVERMTMVDIPRVVEIERLAYTTPWPPSAYRKELQDNPLAHYIVLRDSAIQVPAPEASASSTPRRSFPLSLLPARSAPGPSGPLASTIGFAGLWLMVDEAHITTIALHPRYRGRGLGELMLSSLIQIAYNISARSVTLEVRVTNHVAQNLYRKYGFQEAGVRRRYYSDNNEDALIMWTEPIHSAPFIERYEGLRASLAGRLAAQEAQPDSAAHG